MKTYWHILLFTILISCSGKSSMSDENNHVKTSINSIIPAPNGIKHSQYLLSEKDTIVEVLKHNVISSKIKLGTYQTDSSSIEVITDFKLIPIARGYKGKSELLLIINTIDTLSYEVNNRKSLPIDLYKNQFVFVTDKNQFEFVVPNLISREAVCFSIEWVGCFTN